MQDKNGKSNYTNMNNKVGKLLCRNVQTHFIQRINILYRDMFFIKDNTPHDNTGLVSNYSWKYACTRNKRLRESQDPILNRLDQDQIERLWQPAWNVHWRHFNFSLLTINLVHEGMWFRACRCLHLTWCIFFHRMSRSTTESSIFRLE